MDNRMNFPNSSFDVSDHSLSDDQTTPRHILYSGQSSMLDLRAKIFVNSLPKSGTHLVTSMLELMPGLTYEETKEVHRAFKLAAGSSLLAKQRTYYHGV